jgi:hypothetical protein
MPLLLHCSNSSLEKLDHPVIFRRQCVVDLTMLSSILPTTVYTTSKLKIELADIVDVTILDHAIFYAAHFSAIVVIFSIAQSQVASIKLSI